MNGGRCHPDGSCVRLSVPKKAVELGPVLPEDAVEANPEEGDVRRRFAARGDVEIVGAEGARTPFRMEPGTSYYRAAGVEHDVVNGPGGELRFVEVELKNRAG